MEIKTNTNFVVWTRGNTAYVCVLSCLQRGHTACARAPHFTHIRLVAGVFFNFPIRTRLCGLAALPAIPVEALLTPSVPSALCDTLTSVREPRHGGVKFLGTKPLRQKEKGRLCGRHEVALDDLRSLVAALDNAHRLVESETETHAVLREHPHSLIDNAC